LIYSPWSLFFPYKNTSLSVKRLHSKKYFFTEE